jgi:hypothetical protein
MPAPPSQACAPCRSVSGWFSHTHPQSRQLAHWAFTGPPHGAPRTRPRIAAPRLDRCRAGVTRGHPKHYLFLASFSLQRSRLQVIFLRRHRIRPHTLVDLSHIRPGLLLRCPAESESQGRPFFPNFLIMAARFHLQPTFRFAVFRWNRSRPINEISL